MSSWTRRANPGERKFRFDGRLQFVVCFILRSVCIIQGPDADIVEEEE